MPFDRDRDLEPVLSKILEAFPAIYGIYIFGSQAQGDAGEQSDLDMAVLPNQVLDPVKLWDCSQKIAAKTATSVDLVDLKAVSTVFQFQIISKGERVFSNDDSVCEWFEDFAYSSYLRLNDERKDILEDVKKTGQIYKRGENDG